MQSGNAISVSFCAARRTYGESRNGSTNAYLLEDRIIEDFLKDIAPRYNESVFALRRGEINQPTIYVVAGFAAYVATCSPAAMRIHSAPFRQAVEATSKILD